MQLRRFDDLADKRKTIIRGYDKILLPLGISRLEHFGENYEVAGHLYLMRINSAFQSNNVII